MKNITPFQYNNNNNNNSFNRAWIISDTHFGQNDGDNYWLNIAKQWRNDFLLPTIINNAKPGDALFHLGDVFDKRTSINLNAINFTIETFEILSAIFATLNTNTNTSVLHNNTMFQKYNINHIKNILQKSKNNSELVSSILHDFQLNTKFQNSENHPENNNIINYSDYNNHRNFSNIKIIVGNHDLFRKHDNAINAINILKWLPNVEIIWKYPKVFDLRGNKGILVPWESQNVVEQEIINGAKDIQYYFAHTSVQGALYSGRRVSEHGLDKSSYGSFKRVYTGHIHTTQVLGNVRFVGNPYEMTRNDAGNTKGILLVDFEDGEETLYVNRVSPRWQRLTWDAAVTGDVLADAAEKGDRLDIDLPETMADTVEVRNFLSAAEEKGVKVTLKWQETAATADAAEVVLYDTTNSEIPDLLEAEARRRIKDDATATKVADFLLKLYKENL